MRSKGCRSSCAQALLCFFVLVIHSFSQKMYEFCKSAREILSQHCCNAVINPFAFLTWRIENICTSERQLRPRKAAALRGLYWFQQTLLYVCLPPFLGTPSKASRTWYSMDYPPTPTFTARCATCWQRGGRGRRPAGLALPFTLATTPRSWPPSPERRGPDRCSTPTRQFTFSWREERVTPPDGRRSSRTIITCCKNITHGLYVYD